MSWSRRGALITSSHGAGGPWHLGYATPGWTLVDSTGDIRGRLANAEVAIVPGRVAGATNGHTGSTWSAQTGGTLKEVMARMGRSSTGAAMIYQHATRDRYRAIADALDVLIGTARSGRA